MLRKLLRIEDRTALFACITVALAMWLLNKLTAYYTTDISVAVVYANLPDNKAPTNPLPEKLYLTVRATGVDIIKQLKLSTPQAIIDYQQYANNKTRINTDALIPYFEKQLENIRISDIKPDTILFVFDVLKSKKVAIKVDSNIETATHFHLRSVNAYNPDSVVISGAASVVDTIKFWQTETLAMRDVSQSVKGKIALKTPMNRALGLSTTTTQYEITVEEYTEKSLSIPIQVANLPKGVKVFLYPNVATVYFQVGTNAFDDIDESYFKVEADFKNYNIAANNQIDIAISQAPHNIKNMRTEPATIEYIIMD